MSFRKTNVEPDELTPERAQQHAALPALPGERERKPGRIKFLEQHLRNGTFCGATWAIVKDLSTGIIYRADGQHSSSLLSALPEDVPFPANLLATIETYEMESLAQDGETLFDMFNNPASVRTNKDKMGIFRARFPSLQNIELGLLVTIGNGIAFYEKNLPKGVVLPARQRGTYFEQEKYERFALWIHDLKGSIHGDLIAKVGLLAEMAADLFADQTVAGEFWNLVLNESHPDPDHETRELARSLKAMTSSPRATAESFRKKAQTVWKRYLRSYRAGAQAEMMPAATEAQPATA